MKLIISSMSVTKKTKMVSNLTEKYEPNQYSFSAPTRDVGNQLLMDLTS